MLVVSTPMRGTDSKSLLLGRNMCCSVVLSVFACLLLSGTSHAQPGNGSPTTSLPSLNTGPTMDMGSGSGSSGGSSSGMTTTILAPQEADSEFYTIQPAPAPAKCPYGESTATLIEEMEEGPYYVNEDLFRSNVTETQAGVALNVRITVLDTDCQPVVNAFVDIWSCNATGIYSGYLASEQDAGGTTASRKMLQTGTDDSTFLRGTVLTDSNGMANFYSIFPGWYSGRATHIHMMIHLPEDVIDAQNEYEVYENASHIVHTGRLFFEDTICDEVYELYPYSRHTGTPTTVEEDDTYLGDARTIMTITYQDATDLSAGLVGSAVSVINRTAYYTEGETNTMLGGGGMSTGGMGASSPSGTSGSGSMGPSSGSGMTMSMPTTGRKLLNAQQ